MYNYGVRPRKMAQTPKTNNKGLILFGLLILFIIIPILIGIDELAKTIIHIYISVYGVLR